MKNTTKLFTLVLLLGLATAVRAQDADPAAPAPAPAAQGPQNVSSITQPRVGGGGSERNYLIPQISFTQVYDSVPQYGLSQSDKADMVSNISGSLSLQRMAKTRTFTAGYNGGLLVSNRTRQRSHFHAASLSQEFTGRRSSLVLSNTFRFTPASEFGLTGFGGFGDAGVPGLGSLRPDLRPSQNLLTTPSAQFSNALGAQFSYLAGPRTSVNFSGSYGLLRFRKPGFSEVDQYGFGAGLNRQISARNTLSTSYSGQVLHITGGTEILSHSIHAGFGRQVTGRLRLDVSGGPQISTLTFAVPVADRTLIDGSVRAALSYTTGLSSVAASYSRGMSGGSGVLSGGSTDTVDLTVGTRLSRMWAANGAFGYVRTEGLRGTLQSGTTYHAVSGGGGVARPLGRHYDFFVNYRWYRQVTTVPGADLNRQTVTVGITWNPLAIRLNGN